MKLLKLITASTIVLTAFTNFEAKADNYPEGWTKLCHCVSDNDEFYKLQKTDTPAAYGVWDSGNNAWSVDYVSRDDAKENFNNKCGANTKSC